MPVWNTNYTGSKPTTTLVYVKKIYTRKFYACWCENCSKQKYRQQYLGGRRKRGEERGEGTNG
jgi:hypothetical protein